MTHEPRTGEDAPPHKPANLHIRRQHAIGPYIVDFCAPRQKIIIEVDGGQHLDQQEYNAERTAYFEAKGYCVPRFWNHEVMVEMDGVLQVILNAVAQKDCPL